MPLLESGATAIVHTLGIVALSYSLSSDAHLQAIVPRIEPKKTIHRIKSSPAVQKTGVESHTALIAFRQEDRVGGNWKAYPLSSVPGYLYVAFDGERVDVLDGLPAGRALKAAAMPIDGLPRMQKCCSNAKLRKEFQPPAFSGAAVVVNFPAGNSVTQTCNANIAGAQTSMTPRRIDTLVQVKNEGKLVLSAQGKQIILEGNAEVYLGNVPTRALTNPNDHRHAGAAHYEAFFAMLENTGCGFEQCYAAAVVSCDSVMRQIKLTGRDPRTRVQTIMASGPSAQGVTVIGQEPFFFMDYQCSNTQWP